MRILSKNKDERLAEVQELYSKASSAASDKQVAFDRSDSIAAKARLTVGSPTTTGTR